MAERPPNGAETNWSAAGMVDLFDEANRRRFRWRLILVNLAWLVLLGLPLVLTYHHWQDAARQTLLIEYDLQQSRLATIPAGNPAVDQAIQSSRELRAAARSRPAALGMADLRQALLLIDHAEDLDLELRQLRELLKPVGSTLLETPWHTDSSLIRTKQEQLARQQQTISTLLDEGRLPEAASQLAALLQAVGTLQRKNVEAMTTDGRRADWLRQLARVPDRLKQELAFVAIQSRASQGDTGWNTGDWVNADLCYSGASADLQRFLDQSLTAEEKAGVQQADKEALTRLESEKAALTRQVEDVDRQIGQLQKELVAAGVERRDAIARAQVLSGERDQALLAAAIAKEVPGLQAALQTKTEQLTKTQAELTTLSQRENTLQASLSQRDTQLAASQAEITALKQAASSGSVSSQESQVALALAKIAASAPVTSEQTQTPEQLQGLRNQIAETLQQHSEAVALKKQALAEKYLPTSRKVKDIEQTITAAETMLRSQLQPLDAPPAVRYAQLQGTITQAEQDYAVLLNEVAPESHEALKLKAAIDQLKAESSQLSAAGARHQGTVTPTSEQLLSLCREQVADLLKQRRKEEFVRLVKEGKAPSAAGMRFVPIVPGHFTMGSDVGYPDERPAHEVEITQGFWAGIHEVTTGQILVWLNSPGITVQSDWIDFDDSDCPVKRVRNSYELNMSSSFGKTADQPMVCISQLGARAFCRWCSEQDPQFTYRLPWEAEWESMARAGSATKYPWGDEITSADANIDGGPGVTTAVGSYKPNAWGLYDTVGNVYEWCGDWYAADYYTSSPRQDPQGPSSGSSVVCRSGSWFGSEPGARSGFRYYTNVASSHSNIGFRVVAE